jgi:hypothetical protein
MRPRSVCRIAAIVLGLLGPGAGASPIWNEADLTFETTRWEIGESRAEQSAAVLSGDVAWDERIAAHLELRGSRTTGSQSRIPPGASAAALVGWQPLPEWRFQLGCATPSGIRELDAATLGLSRRVGEPVLALSDPDPARGWRAHLSALWGRSPRRGVGLLLGAGADLAASFRATPDLNLNPADAITAHATVAWAVSGWRAHARLHAVREGADRGAGVVIRGGRTLYGFSLGGGLESSPVRLAAGLDVSRSGVCRVPHPEIYGLSRHPGPGTLGRFVLAAEPRVAWDLGGGLRLRPALDVAWRRVLPEGLPFADGWASSAGVRLAIGKDGHELTLGGIWERGRWRAGEEGAGRYAERLRGWRMSAALRWWRMAAPASVVEADG